MWIYDVDRVVNKRITYNSFRTFAIVSLRFSIGKIPEHETAANMKVCPKLTKIKLSLPLHVFS